MTRKHWFGIGILLGCIALETGSIVLGWLLFGDVGIILGGIAPGMLAFLIVGGIMIGDGL